MFKLVLLPLDKRFFIMIFLRVLYFSYFIIFFLGYPFPQKALVWEGQYKELSSFHDVTWLEDNVKPVIKSYFKDNKSK